MNEPMQRYMKVGLVHCMAYPAVAGGDGPIEETVRRIASDPYFNAIEVTSMNSQDTRRNVKAMLNASGLTVAYLANPRLLSAGLNANDLDPVCRQRTVNALKEGIDEAYELGASSFVFLSGRYAEEKVEEAFNALVDTTFEICEYSSDIGNLKIVLEVFDYAIDKKSLIGPAGLARRYAGAVRANHDNFGLLVDLSHIPLIGESMEEAILPVVEYISHAHIGNCVVKNAALPAYGDCHPRFGFPDSENGVEEVARFLRLLLDVGFLNTEKPPIVSFEVKPFGEEDPEIVIANAKRMLNEAWGKA